MRKKIGFTLLEIMIALAIAAIIMSAGIAPLLYTSRIIRSTREKFQKSNRERYAANRIFADIRGAVSVNEKNPVAIKEYDEITAGANDFLIVRSAATTYTIAPLSSVVWGRPGSVSVRADFEPGLYRWVLSRDTPPGEVNVRELDPHDASLILQDVDEVSFSVPQDGGWTREYTGIMPRALRVTFVYGDGGAVYEEILPNF
ncbi:MAG: prepilin-type N-terminal cleavage/methylation domain-containing protein [Synergistaceae bacterium]|nr:prepilin-type N-terminal cleavage/methylation domain-containing protein [Synergistaceae bacterium]